MNKGRKILEIAVIILAVGFIGYQIFTSYFGAMTTESATYFEYSEGVDLDGIIIRNEHQISMNEEGTLHFLVSDGERVSKGGTIAELYSDDNDSAAATRVAEIDEQLRTIEEIEGYNNIAAVDINTVNARIEESIENFLFSVSSRSFEGAEGYKTELLNSLTKKQVAIGQNMDFTATKDRLNSEKTSLLAVMGTAKSKCVAGESGYFVTGADGYENVFSGKDVSEFTPEYLESLKPESVDSKDIIGKIVSDYDWYIAATVSLDDSMFYKSGDTVKIKIQAAAQTVTAKVLKVNYSKDKNTATVVFSCNEMSRELASMRSGKITVIKKEYEGLRVSQKALRIVDGVTGVYVISGLEIKFVATDIVYSNDEYAICALNTKNDEQLRLYDEVIVRGRGLYDGKIIY
ncbi:MAG: hypothetical protein J6V50_00965 [Clostridia bacterium]|nr:hypothetical protein [Clostridia bacterium]